MRKPLDQDRQEETGVISLLLQTASQEQHQEKQSKGKNETQQKQILKIQIHAAKMKKVEQKANNPLKGRNN
ncbi:hypothetical protein AV530_016719 [Patagioenas fasciata monilis]|uniref:Uncharacterized protein n=1 Tax=Patagioenas fasciata monilis TaxID=372326 RepID=A0A1V4J3C6_PATFA|nr:hypothetical protein AV530_016719 [Patagioenas fasciata monilis]